ncbi:phage tail sheath subtilisin-like domain-containing protein [Sphingomonas sp. CJ99]
MNSFAFDLISAANRVPGSQVEFSNVRALGGLPPAEQKILLIGQRLATGTVPQGQARRITQADQGAGFFGRGSQLAAMIASAIAANSQTELWALGLDDDAAGVAATRTVTITGPATAAGALALLIDGQRVRASVAPGDTATAMATALAAAVNAQPDLLVTAASAAGVVTLTCRHKGTLGNDIDVRANHYDGEVLPAGVGLVVAAATAGATNPDLTDAFAAIGDEQFQQIAIGINDSTNITIAEGEMASRWEPGRQIEGRAWFGASGTLSALLTLGGNRNGVHSSVIGNYRMPTPPWRVAAAVAAVAAFHLQIDPARPLTDLAVPGLVAPAIADRFGRNERNQLLGSGISTLRIQAGGIVAIERLISTYQVNAFAFDDPSFLDVTTTATLGYYRYSWRARMAAKFPRAKLTDDTIRSVRAETIALAREWSAAGLMEDADGFIAGLVIERDATNATQLNVLMTPNTVNGLLQLAARIEFVL